LLIGCLFHADVVSLRLALTQQRARASVSVRILFSLCCATAGARMKPMGDDSDGPTRAAHARPTLTPTPTRMVLSCDDFSRLRRWLRQMMRRWRPGRGWFDRVPWLFMKNTLGKNFLPKKSHE
jgi:hypothetical protein